MNLAPLLGALATSFATQDRRGRPSSLAAECARVLDLTDTTISVMAGSAHITLSASSEDARALDDWEFTLAEGPSLDAAASGTVTVADTAAATAHPWPRLAAKARAIGYRSVAGIPLQAGGTTFGCLALLERRTPITPGTLAEAELIASELAPLVAAAHRRPRSLDQPGERDTFHQATGMVMAQLQIDGGAASELLRTYALSNDRLLMDTASRVVARTLTFRPAGPA